MSNGSTFDPHLVDSSGSPVWMFGECLRFAVVEPGAVLSNVGNRVINPQQPFNVELDWRICGFFSFLWLTSDFLSDNWVVEVFAESIGPGPEIQIGLATVPVQPGSSLPTSPPLPPEPCFNYSATVLVPPNTLLEGNPGFNNPSGVYKLAATVFLNSTARFPLPGADICGFCKGPMIKAENPR